MRYCKRCLYPENHPLNITFDKDGVCSGCRVHEEKDVLDWKERFKRLEAIVAEYKNTSGKNYDCIVPISGGKDSHFIVHTVVKTLGLNPLLVNYNQGFNPKRGIRNMANLLTKFDLDCVQNTLDPDIHKRIIRYSLKKNGCMYWPLLAGQYTFPVQVAVKFKVPLIIWGVHGWSDQVGMYSHLDEVEMSKKVRREHGLRGFEPERFVNNETGLSNQDVSPFQYPSNEELATVGVRGIYLSNYIRWDSKKQHELMIDLYGYETGKQERTFNTYEDVDCFHSAGTHDYIKYLKFGYGKATDHASREIRLKRMTREEGIEMVKQYDHVKPKDLTMFLDWINMTEIEFFDAIDPFRDPKIWENVSGKWQLTDNIGNHQNDDGIDAVRLEKVGDCQFKVTDQRESETDDDHYILMGRGYLDKYNFQAEDDDQDAPIPDWVLNGIRAQGLEV